MMWLPVGVATAGAIAFLALAFYRPVAAFAVILSLAPFSYPLFGSEINVAAGEACALLLAVLAVWRRPVLSKIGPFLPWVAGYSVVCGVSAALNWNEATAVSLAQTAFYTFILVVALATTIENPDGFFPALIGLMGAGVLLAIAALVSRSSYVLDLHKNSVGGSIASALLVAIGLWMSSRSTRSRVLLSLVSIVLVGGLVTSLSRGAWIGAGVGVIVLAVMFSNFRFLGYGVLIAIPAVLAGWFLAPADLRFTAGRFGPKVVNISSRLDFIASGWQTFLSHPLFGAGPGLRKEQDETNILIAVLAETGAMGLMFFAMMHWTLIRNSCDLRSQLRRGDPRRVIAFVGIALVICRLVHGFVDQYWSRGGSLICWAGAAMVIATHRSLKQQPSAVSSDNAEQSATLKTHGGIALGHRVCE